MNKEQQKWIIIGLGVVGLCYLYFSFLFIPATKKIKELRSEYETNKKILEDAIQKAKMLPVLEKNALELQEKLYFTMKRIPLEEDLPNLIKTISSIAIAYDIHITNFEPQKQTPKDFYAEIPFKLTMTASFHNLGEFLNSLSLQARFLSVSDIQLTAVASGASTSGNTVNVVLLLNSYMTKQQDTQQKTVSYVNEKQLSEKEFIIKPLYLYDRMNKRDLFKSLGAMEITASSAYVPISSLRLTGIISLATIKTATLEDTNSSKYTLTDGVLYANDMSVIAGIIGKIEKDKIVLKQIDKETKKIKMVVLEIKK